MKRLADKIALVTGADSGIGQAIAVAFAEEGAHVAMTSYAHPDGAKKSRAMVEATGQRALVVQTDVGDAAQAEKLFRDAVGAFGHVDILVNNAGTVGVKKTVMEMEPEDFERTIRTNLFGPFYLSRLFARHRREQGGGGKLINISSIHEEVVSAKAADYNASKGGLRNLCRTLALELAGDRINVNNIGPGMTLTPMNQEALDDATVRREMEQKIPLKRAAQPDEIAKVALFLASSDADYITGSTYFIDGGFMQLLAQGA